METPPRSGRRLNEQGFVTSVGYSPTLQHFVGLGFVKGGLTRQGERLRMIDHMRDLAAEVEICDPVFYDKDGGRARG